MPTRDTTIAVRVSSEEKSEFEEYIEDTDTRYDSLSDLLRTAAHREMHGGQAQDIVAKALDSANIDVDQDRIIGAVDVALSDTTEELEQIKSRMSNIENNVRTSERTIRLAKSLYSEMLVRLPPGKSLHDLEITKRPNTDREVMRLVGTARALSTVFESESEDSVRRALQFAEENYPMVQSVISDGSEESVAGEMRYWVTDPEAEEWGGVEELDRDYDGFQKASEVDGDV